MLFDRWHRVGLLAVVAAISVWGASCSTKEKAVSVTATSPASESSLGQSLLKRLNEALLMEGATAEDAAAIVAGAKLEMNKAKGGASLVGLFLGGSSAEQSLGLFQALTRGAIYALKARGTEAQKSRFARVIAKSSVASYEEHISELPRDLSRTDLYRGVASAAFGAIKSTLPAAQVNNAVTDVLVVVVASIQEAGGTTDDLTMVVQRAKEDLQAAGISTAEIETIVAQVPTTPTPTPTAAPTATVVPTATAAPTATPTPSGTPGTPAPTPNVGRPTDVDAMGLPGIKFAKPYSIADRDDGYANTKIVKVTRSGAEWTTGVPRKVCGATQATIAARIADCAAQHTTRPTWDDGISGEISWNGTKYGIAKEGSWTLVTVYQRGAANGTVCGSSTCTEVWRDDRTGLVWSDDLGNANWCKAVGSSNRAGSPYAEDDPSDYCDNATYQSQTAPVSLCYEDATWLSTPTGQTDGSTFEYDSAKGGMRKLTSPAVRWRAPTINDWNIAEVNGVRHVLPNMGRWFWSASVHSSYRDGAWLFSGVSGYSNVDSSDRYDSDSYDSDSVRCVGR